MEALHPSSCHCHVIYVTCVASLPFATPHGIVKCPSDAHFRISLEVVNHPGIFHLLFYECYDLLLQSADISDAASSTLLVDYEL